MAKELDVYDPGAPFNLELIEQEGGQFYLFSTFLMQVDRTAAVKGTIIGFEKIPVVIPEDRDFVLMYLAEDKIPFRVEQLLIKVSEIQKGDRVEILYDTQGFKKVWRIRKISKVEGSPLMIMKGKPETTVVTVTAKKDLPEPAAQEKPKTQTPPPNVPPTATPPTTPTPTTPPSVPDQQMDAVFTGRVQVQQPSATAVAIPTPRGRTKKEPIRPSPEEQRMKKEMEKATGAVEDELGNVSLEEREESSEKEDSLVEE